MNPQKVTLETICNGAAAELFEHELAKVLDNVADPNTDAEKKRSISLTFNFKPNANRNLTEIQFACKTALPGVTAVKSSAFIAMDKGEFGLFTLDPRQGELPLIQNQPPETKEETPAPKLVSMKQ